MTYEIQLIEKISGKLVHSFNSVFIPLVGDIILLTPENEICFIVKGRIFTDLNNNRVSCFGSKKSIYELE